MSQFYKKVATPETQRVQSAAPRGATQDAQARIDANKKGFADSIQSLLGVTATVAQAQKQSDERQVQAEEAKDGDAAKITYKQEFLPAVERKVIELSDGDVEMQTPFLYEQATEQVRNELMSRGDYSDSFKNSFNRKIEDYRSLAESGFMREVRGKRLNASVKSFVESERATVQSSLDPESTVATLKENLDTKESTGYFEDLGVDRELYEQQIVSALIQEGMQAGGAAAVNTRDMVRSTEFQDTFLSSVSKEEREAYISTAETVATTAIIKRQEEEFLKLETGAFTVDQFNAFKSTASIKDYIEKQTAHLKEWQKPNPKQLSKLVKDLSKGIPVSNGVEQYRAAVKAGNLSFLETSGLSDKNQSAIHSKFSMQTLSLPDLSYGTVETMLLSGDKNTELTALHSTTGRAIKEMKDYFNVLPTTAEGMAKQATAFSNLEAELMGTPNAGLIHHYASPKISTRLRYINSLAVDHTNLGAGANVTKEQFQAAMTEFDSDRKKNTNSRGLYRSEEAIAILKDEKIQKEITEFAEEGSGFFQDSTAQNYKKEAMEDIIALLSTTGTPKDSLLEEANKIYTSRHATFEQPSGDEGVLPFEWRDVSEEDIHAVLATAPALQSYRDAALILGYGSKYDMDDFKLEPSNSYGSDRDMVIMVGDTPVMALNRKAFDKLTKYAYSKETQQLRKDFTSAREIRANVGVARRGYKAINADTLKEK